MFLFSEILINNRDKLKESESFVLTCKKIDSKDENTKKRINVKKITYLNEMIDRPYSKVTIELKENFKIEEIKEILSENGNTEINLIIKNQNKKVNYFLQNNRKFDLELFKMLKTKEYVEKIIV